MTREEAIKIIDKGVDIGNQMPFLTVDQMNEAKQKAIKALEQEPSEDAISRQAAIDVAKEECEDGTFYDIPWKIAGLPSVNLQEPSNISNDGTLTVNVEDGRKISRVLVCGANHWGGLYYPDEQEPKTGHWIPVSEYGYPKPEEEYKHFLTVDIKGEITIQEFLLSPDEEPQPYFTGWRDTIAWMPLPKPYKFEPQESEGTDADSGEDGDKADNSGL